MDLLKAITQGVGNLLSGTVFDPSSWQNRGASSPLQPVGQAYTSATTPQPIISPLPSNLTMTQAGGTYNPPTPPTSLATSSPTPTGGGGGDTRLQQLQKTNRNPGEEDELQRILREQADRERG